MHALQSIAETMVALRKGHVTPRDLVEDCLSRIERLEPQLKAWVVVDAAGARSVADDLGRQLRVGTDRGPLHGIPLGIKDIVDVQGLPTRAGSPLTSSVPASADATVVARLRAAGAIMLGKTVTTEFACFEPSPTRNPWNLDHTPGGSSSGSAAATAVGMCFGAIGSQTGGSITRPASYCGVAGFKPTFGRVSRAGVVPVSFHLDHVGAMARSAADCSLIVQAIAGDDPLDPACSAGHRLAPAGAFEGRLASPRFGVLRSFFFDQADAETAQLIDQAIDKLAAAGAQVADVPLPAGFEQVHVLHRQLMACEAADYHRRTFGAPRPEYSANMAGLLDEGFRVTLAQYQAIMSHQRGFAHAVARSLADFDALVTPATLTPAPATLTTTGDARFNSPWSYAGVPTLSLPCGLSAGGMPVSLQLIGAPWTEISLAQTADWCERQIGFVATPPIA